MVALVVWQWVRETDHRMRRIVAEEYRIKVVKRSDIECVSGIAGGDARTFRKSDGQNCHEF
jgi:hypothetical protein